MSRNSFVWIGVCAAVIACAEGRTFAADSGVIAGDTHVEVRPSHLLNFETAGTLAPQQLVVSGFGSSGRAAYGAAPNLETRIDAHYLSLGGDQHSLGLMFSGKYHLYNDKSDLLGIGVMAQGGSEKALNGSAVNSISALVPITLKLPPVLVTMVPFVSQNLVSGAGASKGGQLGVAVPLFSFLDGILETSYISGDVSGPGYTAGIVIKPSNRISVPLIFVNKAPGQQLSAGLVSIFAHIGFEL